MKFTMAAENKRTENKLTLVTENKPQLRISKIKGS